jgi:hypothetical protein
MKYGVEMGSGSMIYVRNFINTGSGFQKWTGSGEYAESLVNS